METGQKKMRPMLAFVLAGWLVGCGAEDEGPATGHSAWQPNNPNESAVPVLVPASNVIALVQHSVAPDGTGTVAQWIQRAVDQPTNQYLFMRWTSTRTAAQRYEVRFTFTEVHPDGSLFRKGFSWQAHPLQDRVDGPFPVEMENATPRMMSSSTVFRNSMRTHESFR